jgi:hypothetical protein
MQAPGAGFLLAALMHVAAVAIALAVMARSARTEAEAASA